MLKHRVIPVVLLDGYSVLKTIRFDVRRNLGNPITVARIYNTRNVDELVLLDIDASKRGDKIDDFTIAEVASECFMPLSVGGGLRTCEDISGVLARGADKVVINTAFIDNPEFVSESSGKFGVQCIVASVDVKKDDGGNYRVFSHSGRSIDNGVVAWIRELERRGAGEIMLNSVDNDGAMGGFDLELISMVASAISVPLIAVGGASMPADAVSAVQKGASAVAAASIFHFTDFTPNDLKKAMKRSGLPARI